ncbi:MAG: hypothetical protein ACYDG6_05330 [Thermincolia bacterium]
MFEHDYTLVGKHATYTKFLKDEADVFDRYIDVYMNGAILGFLFGRKSTRDTGSSDRARVYADAFATERMRCDFIYRLIMLLDETTGYAMEDRVDRAFRDDATGDESEKNIKNMELFNSYVLGGIEVLYERFAENCTTKDDYINRIYEVVTNFKDEIEGIPYSEKIKEVIADYNIG